MIHRGQNDEISTKAATLSSFTHRPIDEATMSASYAADDDGVLGQGLFTADYTMLPAIIGGIVVVSVLFL